MPDLHGRLTQETVIGGGELIAGKVVKIVDRVVNGGKALQMICGFETLHDPFSSPDRLMGIFGPVVKAFMLSVITDCQPDFSIGCPIRAKLISDHDAG